MQHFILITTLSTAVPRIWCCHAVVPFSCIFSIIPLHRYNQINAIAVACSMGVQGCRELIKSWYSKWMENPHHNP